MNFADKIEQQPACKAPMFAQLEQLVSVAEKLGLGQVVSTFKESIEENAALHDKNMSLEATLFRLKQISLIRKLDGIGVQDLLNVASEEAMILNSIAKPIGVDISKFSSRSKENHDLIVGFIQKLKSGEICLS